MPEGYPYHHRGISEKTSSPNLPEKKKEEILADLERQKQVEGVENYEIHQGKETEASIQSINDAYKKMLEGTNLKPFVLDLTELHVLPPTILQKYREQVAGVFDEPTPFTLNGQIYLPSDLPRDEYWNAITHEYMHASSQLKTLITMTEESDSLLGDEEETKFSRSSVMRLGVAQSSKSQDKGKFPKSYATGLNEAITELLTTRLRSQIELPKDKKFSGDFANEFGKNPSAYRGVIRLFEAVVKKYFDDDLQIGSPTFIKLMRLFVAADPAFLRELNEKMRADGHKDGLKILYDLDGQYDTAKKAAVEFGLDPEEVFASLNALDKVVTRKSVLQQHQEEEERVRKEMDDFFNKPRTTGGTHW